MSFMKHARHTYKRRSKGSRLIAVGCVLLLAAACLVGFNLWDSWRAGKAASDALKQLETMVPLEDGIDPSLLDPARELPTVTIDGLDYVGTLKIVALDLELPILAEWSYPNLRVAPCRYAGTPYAQNFVIAAHNYASHFGGLNQLQEGDSVVFTDVDGNAFTYQVYAVEVLDPTAVDEMTAGEFPLTLFTCTLGGATRVTVRCVMG